MKYISTRDKNSIKEDFSKVLKKNLSMNKGLYVCERYLNIRKEVKSLKDKTFIEVVSFFLNVFTGINFSNKCSKVYLKENFPLDKNIISLKKINKRLFLAKISNGKSMSFKDVAVSLISFVLKNEKKVACATSGDTGSSCALFFKNTKVKTFIFSPYNKISKFQFSQIGNIYKKNIYNMSICGNFDDCQNILKNILSKSKEIITINSINWFRIIIQSSYYLYIYLKLKKYSRKKLDFLIPTGNFGNAYSAFLLKQMGIPININVITNENDMLYTFFNNGIYENNRKTVKTNSPSMDISKASNIERFLFDIFGRNYKLIRSFYKKILKKNSLKIRKDFLNKYKIYCGKVNKKSRKFIISKFYKKMRYLFDTHTGNALSYYYDKDGKNKRNKKKNFAVILETAKCVKFTKEIEYILKKKLECLMLNKYKVNYSSMLKKKKMYFFFKKKDLLKISNFIKIYSQ
ncbi:threonine synthase [Candidatus Vidania fulgoroideorum]